VDDHGFQDLVEPYRHELRLHCYRMLGSFTDAEDALQETLLAAWRGLPAFEGRSSMRAWLYRIATNRCLNARRDDARRIPAEPLPPFDPPEPSRRGEITWLQPYPDPAAGYELKESVHLAFIAGLQRMPPRQTAVLVLRDVLGFGADEVAAMLGTTATAVKGSLQRARASMDKPPMPDATAEPGLVRRFADAFAGRDLDALVALLTDDAWLAMPPAPHEYHGAAAIAGFLAVGWAWQDRRRLVLVPARANGQPAFACYLAGPGERVARPAGLMVLTLHGDRIAGLTRFHDNAALLRAGLLDPLRPAG
jgi:RNA polymerase sigma-70 factor (TIGR02960 family)